MHYIGKISKVTRLVSKNPSLLMDIYRYLRNDVFSIIGAHNYAYRTIFIAGLPKSGTTWVESQLKKVPGYNMRMLNDPDGCIVEHNICDSVFASLPRYGYSVVKLHTRYSERNIETIRRHVPRFMVMIRDLRDMCISRYFHVKSEKSHRHCHLYNESSLEDGIMHCIGIVAEEYVQWVCDWVNMANKNKDFILLISYEELNRSPAITFKRIFDFFHLPYNATFLDRLAESKLKREKDLKAQLERNTGLSKSTERKGIIGDWRNYFSGEHKRKFKEIAGELLVELGYENDLEW